MERATARAASAPSPKLWPFAPWTWRSMKPGRRTSQRRTCAAWEPAGARLIDGGDAASLVDQQRGVLDHAGGGGGAAARG